MIDVYPGYNGSCGKFSVFDNSLRKVTDAFYSYEVNNDCIPIIYNNNIIDFDLSERKTSFYDVTDLETRVTKRYGYGVSTKEDDRYKRMREVYVQGNSLFILTSCIPGLCYREFSSLHKINLLHNKYEGREKINNKSKATLDQIKLNFDNYSTQLIKAKETGFITSFGKWTVLMKKNELHVTSPDGTKSTYPVGCCAAYIYDKSSDKLIIAAHKDTHGEKASYEKTILTSLKIADLLTLAKNDLAHDIYREKFSRTTHSFFRDLDYNSKNIDLLRAYSEHFPEQLSSSDFDVRMKTAFDSIAKSRGYTIIGAIASSNKGERYKPELKSSYTTTEDDGYYVNGNRIDKYTHKKKTYTDGGYYVDITGYNLNFAIDNDSLTPGIVNFEATWTESEFYYGKKRVCLASSIWGCTDWGTENEKRVNYGKRHYKQNFLIGGSGRAKHKIFLGEEEPDDLTYYIRDSVEFDSALFDKFDYINSDKALENRAQARIYYENIYKNSNLKDFSGALKDRMNKVETHHKTVFNDENKDLVSLQLEFDKKYDSDFESSVALVITSKDRPLAVSLKTPVGKKNNQLVKTLSSGWEVFGSCFFCEYTTSVKVDGIKGYSKERLSEFVVIDLISDPDDIWNTDRPDTFIKP